MYNYQNIFNSHIDKIIKEGRYREFVQISRIADRFPFAFSKTHNKEVIMWCINDYLGMSRNKEVLKAAEEAMLRHGIGSGGTRNIGGNNSCLAELESELADLHNKELALVFTSGYVANEASLASLARIMNDLVFFSDESNHASIISGIYNTKAPKFIYKHLDMLHLEELLQSVPKDKPKIIVFESVYSMDGLFSPIEKICELAKKYNALTFIDEVHSVGLYGKTGAGIANLLGYDDKIDIIQGTLGKAFGTIGGYITGRKEIIDAIRLTASGFIFTTSLPPMIAAAAKASINHLKNSNEERENLHKIVAKVKKAFDAKKINYFKNESHILPIIIGDPIKAKQASIMLIEKYNIYVQHINFPTVPKGTERLRIISTPYHTDEMIQDLADSLVKVFQALDIEYQKQAA